jgi:hypothetical protein
MGDAKKPAREEANVADSRRKTFDLGVELPAAAVLSENIEAERPVPAGTAVQLIRAEIVDDSDVLLWFTYADGQGVCRLEQITLESNEEVTPGSAIDVRGLCFRLLEKAQGILQRDKYLSPLAFVIKNENLLCVPLSFEGGQEKKSAYARLISLAKAHRALAIVTVNDVHWSRDNDTSDEYYEGQLAATGAPEAIWVTVSGPAITTWTIMSRYSRRGEKIVFDQNVEDTGYTLNLLEGWASNKILPKN